MSHACFALAVVMAFVLQTKVSIFGISPALTVGLVYYFGINNNSAKGLLFGSMIGIVEDSIAGSMLGPNLLGKGMAGFFSSYMFGRLFRWTPMLGIIGLFMLTIMDGLAVFLSHIMFKAVHVPANKVIATLLIQGIINSVFGIFVRPKNAE